MNEEEKIAIEYLKARLYGNEGCKLIDVAQSDLRIIINLVDRVLKQEKEKNKELKKIVDKFNKGDYHYIHDLLQEIQQLLEE